MQKDADVIIAGGGLVGSALALGLAQAGMQVIVVDPLSQEAQTDTRFDGRVSAIALASKRILEALNAWQYIAPHAEPITHIHVVDDYSALPLDFQAQEVGAEPFGYMVENRVLREALFRAVAEDSRIRFITGQSVTHYAPQGASVTATLQDGTLLRAGLLCAADGRLSKLRDIAGIDYKLIEYGQTAMVCTIAHTRPHRGVALERFFPSGPFAVLPMQENRSCIVWSEPPRMAEHYMALPAQEFAQELKRRAGDSWGDMTVLEPRYSYPLRLMIAKKLTAERFALVGDAAHGIHPVAGQGVNLGYRGIAVLIEHLAAAHKNGLDIGSEAVLARYARDRRVDVISMTAMTDGVVRLFSNNTPGVRLARRMGLAAVNAIPPLKGFFMRHAMGLTGKVPQLMQPRP